MNFSESIALMNYFERLPYCCISEIISKTTPGDAVRATILSKEFKIVAESDDIWGRFLPSDYREIIAGFEFPPVVNTKRELFFSLCDSPILIDGGKLSFFLDKHTGKKCFMIAASELTISGNRTYFWQWKKHPNSRFSEVANFCGARSVSIRGKIASQMLSKRTTYAVYLVFKLAPSSYFGLAIGNAVIRFVNPYAKERRLVRRISWPNAQRRVDNWMEIEMGEFFNDTGDDGDVQVRLMDITCHFGIDNLFIEGIEFRPK